jgi:hypothetical protein
MRSATLELLKYFQREGIQCLGNPYVEFADVPPGPAIVHTDTFLCGLLRMVRVTAGDRFLVQWWAPAEYDASGIDIHELLAVLEIVVEGNRVLCAA